MNPELTIYVSMSALEPEFLKLFYDYELRKVRLMLRIGNAGLGITLNAANLLAIYDFIGHFVVVRKMVD
jgi:hypothetical protein